MGSSGSKAVQQGYHILQVSPGGPGEESGLIPYFDFIVELDGRPVVRVLNTITE